MKVNVDFPLGGLADPLIVKRKQRFNLVLRIDLDQEAWRKFSKRSARSSRSGLLDFSVGI